LTTPSRCAQAVSATEQPSLPAHHFTCFTLPTPGTASERRRKGCSHETPGASETTRVAGTTDAGNPAVDAARLERHRRELPREEPRTRASGSLSHPRISPATGVDARDMSAESASQALQICPLSGERPLPQPPGNVTRNGLGRPQKASPPGPPPTPIRTSRPRRGAGPRGPRCH
jgi:hypothetical protein